VSLQVRHHLSTCAPLAVSWDTSACLGFAQPPTFSMRVDNDAFERSEARAYLQFDLAVLRAAALRWLMLQQQQACTDVCHQYRGLWQNNAPEGAKIQAKDRWMLARYHSCVRHLDRRHAAKHTKAAVVLPWPAHNAPAPPVPQTALRVQQIRESPLAL